MKLLALALALASAPSGLKTKLPPAPLELYRVAWHRPFVPVELLQWKPVELGGPAVDPTSGIVVFGTRDGWLHAVRPDGSVVWEFQGGAPFVAPPAVDADTVYAGCNDGRLYALALANGKERWRYDAKEEMGTRPLVADGTVFIASLQDTVFAVDARTGAWKWHHRREPRQGFTIRGAASVVGGPGVVYAGYSDGFVAALDSATGQPRWERQVAPSGDYLDVDALRLDGSRLYAAAYSGAVLAIEAESGKVIWQFQAPTASRLTLAPGLVVAVTANAVYGISRADGTAAWSTPLQGAPGGDPALAGRWLAVPASQGGLRWLEAASGRTLRVFDPGTGVSGTPAVSGSRIYVVTNGGDLFALDVR